MHSGRMRTGRSKTVCWSLLPGGGCPLPGGGGCLLPGGEGFGGSAPGGGIWSGGVCLLPGGVVSGLGGWGGIPACTEADPLPPPREQNE